LQTTEVAPHHALSVTRTADGGSLALHVDGAERLQVECAAEMIGAIFQTVLELRRGDNSWMALIHGASVAVGNVGVLLSGVSGSGKSTLAAYLSARGFDYLSDDLIALSNPEGEIVPWPVPHSLKRGSWKTLEHLYPEIADAKIERINGREMKFMSAPLEAWNRKGVDAQLLVFPHYDSGSSTVAKRIAPLLALQRLVEDRIWLGNPIEKSTVQVFLEKLEKIPAFILQYNDLQRAEESIRELINRVRDGCYRSNNENCVA
jgi:HPr serine kinase-like protein